jgi:hypothetical protein
VGTNDATESTDDVVDAEQIQQNAQSQQQWVEAMHQGQGAHQQHPPPPILGHPTF